MKYRYLYQSRDNKSCEGVITAKDRNDAYNLLRKQGIKPYKVIGRNPIAWKRWTAIGVLGAAVAALSFLQVAERPVAETEEPRAQLYGDPAIIQQLSTDGWRRTFPDAGDAWFARHAIPASLCDCRDQPPTNMVLSVKPLDIGPSEPQELAKMKRMVNGMKREFAAYCVNGNTAADYMALCDERLAIERGHVAIYRKAFDAMEKSGGDIETIWEQKNEELREMGLPTVPMPLDGD